MITNSYKIIDNQNLTSFNFFFFGHENVLLTQCFAWFYEF